jgi:hypothetical protein
VLTALPASGRADSHIFIGQHPLENRLSIQGLDLAYIVNASSDYAQVVFR